MGRNIQRKRIKFNKNHVKIIGVNDICCKTCIYREMRNGFVYCKYGHYTPQYLIIYACGCRDYKEEYINLLTGDNE